MSGCSQARRQRYCLSRTLRPLILKERESAPGAGLGAQLLDVPLHVLLLALEFGEIQITPNLCRTGNEGGVGVMKLSRLNVTPPADIVQTGPVCKLCIQDLKRFSRLLIFGNPSIPLQISRFC